MKTAIGFSKTLGCTVHAKNGSAEKGECHKDGQHAQEEGTKDSGRKTYLVWANVQN